MISRSGKFRPAAPTLSTTPSSGQIGSSHSSQRSTSRYAPSWWTRQANMESRAFWGQLVAVHSHAKCAADARQELVAQRIEAGIRPELANERLGGFEEVRAAFGRARRAVRGTGEVRKAPGQR